jgi:hypothetical protein
MSTQPKKQRAPRAKTPSALPTEPGHADASKVVGIGIDPVRVVPPQGGDLAAVLATLRRDVAAWDSAPPVDPESQEGQHRQLIRDSLRNFDQIMAARALDEAAALLASNPSATVLPSTPEKPYELPQQPGGQPKLAEDVPQTFKRGKREATGGYLPKSRVATTMLGVHLPDDVAEDFKLIARLQGKTAAKILGAFVTQYVEAHKSPQQVEAALQEHVRNLSGDRKTPLAAVLKSLAKPQK